MMRRVKSGLTLLAVAVTGHVVAAQGTTMTKPMANEKSYTGCLEAGSTAGTFTLTHAAMAMAKDAMAQDGMAKDGMGKGAMAPEAYALAGTGVDFAAHVGHKVSVMAQAPKAGGAMMKNGMPGDAMKHEGMGMEKAMPSLTVSSLTMVATTCK